MKTWKVLVEDQFGIVAEHLVDAVFLSSAREIEEEKGFKVITGRWSYKAVEESIREHIREQGMHPNTAN